MERGLGILFAYLTQVCFFKEIPSGLDVAGSAIITCTILFVSVRKLVEGGARSGAVRTLFCLGKWDPEGEPLSRTDDRPYESFTEYLSISSEYGLRSF